MDEMIKCVKEVDKMICGKLKSYMDNGIDIACLDDVGATADSIKDLTESLYYLTVTKAMIDSDERRRPMPYENERMGYIQYMDGDIDEPNRDSKIGYRRPHMNSRMGYRPYLDEEPYIKEYLSDNGRYYDEYKDAKRHYTETHSMNDKRKMDENTMSHVKNTVGIIKEMWTDAEPELRKDMKAELTSLLSMM